MKSTIAILLASCAGLLLLSGCETTSYEKGVIAGASAKIVFDAPQDEAKFDAIKADIEAFLASGRTITEEIVSKYAETLKSELSPAVIELVVLKLRAEIRIGSEREHDANEFLRGLSDAL